MEDLAARQLFETTVLAQSKSTQLPGKEMVWIDAHRGGRAFSISEIVFAWVPDDETSGHCGYDVYVYDSDMNAVFKGYIPGALFDDGAVKSHEMPVPDGPITDTSSLWIRLVPVYDSGTLETFFDVSALGS